MTKLAKDTGLSRASLYKTMSPGNKPQFDTIIKITNALGVPISIKPGGEADEKSGQESGWFTPEQMEKSLGLGSCD